MSIILDCSATIAWCFSAETTKAVESLFAEIATGGAIVPSIWPLEVANVLSIGVRKGRLTIAQRHILLSALRQFDIRVDTETGSKAWDDTLFLAERYRLTTYDASYLELAVRLQLPLATLDQRLLSAALAEGVARRVS